MRRLSENSTLSFVKKFSDCIPTLTIKRLTFIHNHACRSIPNICCY